MLLFTWLSRRPENSVVYYPNRILKGLDPWEGGSRSRNPFAWIREAFSSSEQDVINMSGVDTAVYFVFLSTALAILVLSGLILLPVLLPVAATDDNLKTQKTFSEIDKLLMGNVKDDSPRLWAFLFAAYWVSLVTYFLLWKAYVHVSVLRANALMALGLKPEQFAVLVRDIPPSTEGQTRKEQTTKRLTRFMKSWKGIRRSSHMQKLYMTNPKKQANQMGLRPTTKTGTLGLVESNSPGESNKLVLLPSSPIGMAAASAAQSLHAQMVDTWTVMEAPEPRQVIWSNLKIKYFQRIIRHSQDSAGSLPSSDCTHRVFGTVAQVTLWPSPRPREFLQWAMQTFKSIEKEPNSIVKLLASSLPGNASFFLTFVALKFFVGYGLELSRVVPLIIFHLKKKYLCKTEAELKQAWFPGDLGYATRIPGDMLVITIALCYSVIAPLIIPFGVVYFGLGWLVLRNQALKVYVPSFESYGKMWPHINARVLAALILFQVTIFGYLGLKKFSSRALFLIPLPILSLLFAYVCKKKFYRSFSDTALEVASRELKEIPDMETVFRSYIPPSLSSEKADDDHFEDALPQVSRIGSVCIRLLLCW
ncbi:putative MEMBRANE PROTEIN DUF221-RELATED [Salix koriyanagi]|uniref:MEMBRANE PROTEIN DUF221-RELATED n=1 Tax=Salix koriyanagi TaxID=2511006 RepID=A0A9Q1AM31_9ROSI|nr:putative MEMBRANE PROTEIN DUF221-RELATED [Salix koriyanagi]